MNYCIIFDVTKTIIMEDLLKKQHLTEWHQKMMLNNGKLPKNYSDIIGTCCNIFKENKSSLLDLFGCVQENEFITKYGYYVVNGLLNLDNKSRGSSHKFMQLIQLNKFYGPFKDHLGTHISLDINFNKKIQNFVIIEINECLGINLLKFNNKNVKIQIVDRIIYICNNIK